MAIHKHEARNKHEARSVDDGIALKLDYLMVAQLYKSTKYH